jgi:hypothetical protein
VLGSIWQNQRKSLSLVKNNACECVVQSMQTMQLQSALAEICGFFWKILMHVYQP